MYFICVSLSEMYNIGEEESWRLEPRKWVGEGIVDYKMENDAFCWAFILM